MTDVAKRLLSEALHDIMSNPTTALWNDDYHQDYGPVVAKKSDRGAVFDPDVPSAHWLTGELRQNQPPEYMAKSMLIAEELFRWMSNDLMRVNKDGFDWVHTPTEFLPANVTCDYAGKRGFINEMARKIDGVADVS